MYSGFRNVPYQHEIEKLQCDQIKMRKSSRNVYPLYVAFCGVSDVCRMKCKKVLNIGLPIYT